MPNTLSDTINSQDDLKNYLVGTVVNVSDPLNLGRVQATVPGMFEGSILPWIAPIVQSPFGSGNQFGFFGSPQVGSKITVELQDGDAHKPLYTGGWRGPTDTPPEFIDPTIWGFKDPTGNTLVVNSSNITLTSALGVVLSFTGLDLTITSPGSINATAMGAINLNTSGTANLRATGAVTVQSAGTLNVGGSVVNIAADSIVNVSAPIINLNPS